MPARCPASAAEAEVLGMRRIDFGSHRSATALAAALVLALAACAPAATSPLATPSADEDIIAIHGPEGTVEARLRRDDFVGRSEIAVNRVVAWRQLPAVWQELGLPEPVADPRSYTLAITSHTVQRRLGRANLSTYLDCGAGITGQNADTYRIRLSVRTMLERIDESATRVHTRVDATAHSTGGASAAALPCSSRGVLENQIARLLDGRAR
jgi:hypothetical protein